MFHSQEELLEYVKCSGDIVYFIEKYCKMMIDGGRMKNIKLYDYQKEVIKNYQENKFNIFFTSKQVGMSSLMSLIFLHFISFNIDKNIICMDISDKYNQNLIKKIKYTYLSLPFFLKQGILTWSNKNIQFENGCSITTWVNRKNISVGYCPDILYMCNFARMKHKDDLYKNSIPTMSTRKENRLIIHSGQNGYDTFYKLVVNSEKLDGDPDKNMYKTQRIYWWQVPGRDINWKSNMIKTIGEDMWNEEYDMVFFDKNKK